MNKSVMTNLVALAMVAGGYFVPVYGDVILMTGLFALSGGMTNWLAIHMLFEKIPLLYGSGIIPNRFEEFRFSIKQLVMKEFFTPEHVAKFLRQNMHASVTAISDRINFDQVFEDLISVIKTSPMGSMLSIIGGQAALEPLREPTITKLQEIIVELGAIEPKESGDNDFGSVLIDQVEQVIDNRLLELTPDQVKHIVQNIIRKHLGWLVVWGGVFGGFIGFAVSIMSYLG